MLTVGISGCRRRPHGRQRRPRAAWWCAPTASTASRRPRRPWSTPCGPPSNPSSTPSTAPTVPRGLMKFVDEYAPGCSPAGGRGDRDARQGRAPQPHGGAAGHTHTIYKHGIERAPGQHRAGGTARVPGVRHPHGTGRRRHRPGRAAQRHLHQLRRHDAGAREQGQPARSEGSAPTCAWSTRRSTPCASPSPTPTARWCSSPSASRPPRRPPRSRSSRPGRRGITNFSVFSNHVTIVPPLKAILESPDLRSTASSVRAT